MSSVHCTCTHGSYARHGYEMLFDIVEYDPACPEHGDEPVAEMTEADGLADESQ
jgi:hypothetical protein